MLASASREGDKQKRSANEFSMQFQKNLVQQAFFGSIDADCGFSRAGPVPCPADLIEFGTLRSSGGEKCLSYKKMACDIARQVGASDEVGGGYTVMQRATGDAC